MLLVVVSEAYSMGIFLPSGSNTSNDTYTPSRPSAEEVVSTERGTCTSVPDHVKVAYTEAQAFSAKCTYAKLAKGKVIAVNDYTGVGAPTMYIFDQSGECLMASPISWGMGLERNRRLEACSTPNCRKTPPGFHLTARHNGARYNDSNSLGLAGLSGQDSLGVRGVLIHAKRRPGAGNTWGCTGVPAGDFFKIKQLLGVGSLVYNKFSDPPNPNCGDDAGVTPTCKPEPAAIRAANQARGGSPQFLVSPSESGSDDASDEQGSTTGVR